MTRVRVAPSWLALREPADYLSRTQSLVAEVRRALPREGPIMIHDLACGTGSMLRWLAPQLPGPQHWVVHDLDAELLARLDATPDLTAEDGSPVTVEIRCDDVTRLRADHLADADLITSSALLDLLTAEELDRLVESCAAPGCAVLVTTTVTGAVELLPQHPLDAAIGAAFNAHQRRPVAGGRALLGPDAADAGTRMFSERGRVVDRHPSPWTLDAEMPELTAAWLDGWLDAATEQEPRLAADLDGYLAQRQDDLLAGRLRVRVEHCDLFVRPVGTR